MRKEPVAADGADRPKSKAAEARKPPARKRRQTDRVERGRESLSVDS